MMNSFYKEEYREHIFHLDKRLKEINFGIMEEEYKHYYFVFQDIDVRKILEDL